VRSPPLPVPSGSNEPMATATGPDSGGGMTGEHGVRRPYVHAVSPSDSGDRRVVVRPSSVDRATRRTRDGRIAKKTWPLGVVSAPHRPAHRIGGIGGMEG
jgi:hypothetical protein